MDFGAVDNSVDFIFGHHLCAHGISVAEQGYEVIVYGYYAVDNESITCVGKDDVILLEILALYRSDFDCRAAKEERQHTVAFDGYGDIISFE